MKTLVVTDERGKLVGLVRDDEEERVEGGPAEIRLEPLEGQQVHEIELPPELEGIDSALDLHETIERDYAFDAKSTKLTPKGGASA
jgi:hypothetical protein